MKAIAKSVVLLFSLLVVQAFAVPDPGWLSVHPSALDDTLNINSYAWTGVWLRNPSDSFAVTITGITSNQPWLSVLQTSSVIIQNGSWYLPLMLNAAGSGGGGVAQVTIFHTGFNSPKVVNVVMHVSTNPPQGALIDVTPHQLNLELEPYLSGELKLKVSNSGDLPLHILHCQTSSPIFLPMIDTATITPMAPVEIPFMVNTNFTENMTFIDSIRIMSDATNYPILAVPIVVHILADSVPGTFGWGDANSDGWFNFMDLYSLISFNDGTGPMPCMPATDMNGDGILTGADVTYMVRYLKGIYPGHPPNICPYPPSNFLNHLPNRQIAIDNITSHRGDWVDAPVMVQTPSFYLMQTTMGYMGNIIDSVNASGNAAHPELSPTARLLDPDSASKTIVLYEQNMSTSRIPVPFPSLMPIYDLRLHIPMDAPVGSYQLFPKIDDERGPSLLNSSGGSMDAPMFTGTNLTIAPRVALGNISGVGELIYVPDSALIHPSVTVNCDGPAIGDIYMVIRDSLGTIVYTDTLYNFPLHLGINQLAFTRTWIARGGHSYIAGAGVVVNGDDYPTDNFGGIRMNMTNQITIGLPPTEDFEPGLILDFPPVGYSIIKRPDPPGGTPSWKESADKARSGTHSIAVLGQTDEVEDEWFVKGPMDWTSVNEPEIQFYEAQSDWTDYGYRHEMYVYVGEEFNVEDAIDDGALITQTPGTHTIVTGFSIATMQEVDLSAYGNTNNVWFAFRYLKDPEKVLGDNWYIDDISWVDNAPGPSGYEYIPGDANMGVVAWPTSLDGGDVTRMVRYFKGLNEPCVFRNPLAHHAPTPDTLADTVFYAAADANGNCETRGSDVTRLVSYFKSTAPAPASCVDYPPITPIEANFPACTTPLLKK
jgi:hypothetical protein